MSAIRTILQNLNINTKCCDPDEDWPKTIRQAEKEFIELERDRVRLEHFLDPDNETIDSAELATLRDSEATAWGLCGELLDIDNLPACAADQEGCWWCVTCGSPADMDKKCTNPDCPAVKTRKALEERS